VPTRRRARRILFVGKTRPEQRQDGSIGGWPGFSIGMPGDGMFGGSGTSRTGGPGSCHGTGSGMGDGGVGSGGIGIVIWRLLMGRRRDARIARRNAGLGKSEEKRQGGKCGQCGHIHR